MGTFDTIIFDRPIPGHRCRAENRSVQMSSVRVMSILGIGAW